MPRNDGAVRTSGRPKPITLWPNPLVDGAGSWDVRINLDFHRLNLGHKQLDYQQSD